MGVRAKRRWGSQPHREGGKTASLSEAAYLRKAMDARLAGAAAARNPRCTEFSCPPGYSDEQRSYWLDGFRTERRRRA